LFSSTKAVLQDEHHLNTRTQLPAVVAGTVCRKVAVGGRGEVGISGGFRGGVVDRLGRLPDNSGSSSDTAAAGGMGGWGCEAAVDSSPVAEDGEGDEDS
jgi:hypothetical protein